MLVLLATLLTFRPVDADLPKSGMWRHGFAVADMNGDGRPDLVFTSPRKNPGPPVIFLNRGNDSWSRWEAATFPALPFDYGAVAAADFDGNGAADLAVGCHYRGVIVLLGDGAGRFAAVNSGFDFPLSARETSPFSSRAVTVTDWNADGRLDVAALSDGPRPLASAQLGVTLYENLGSAWNPARATGTTDRIFGDSIAAGDVDGDGLPDLVTASHTAGDRRVLRLNADGALAHRELETLRPAAIVAAAGLADFDRDGRDEIVIGYTVAAPGGASLEVVSFPAASRAPQQLWSEDGGAAVTAVSTGDVNGDGAIDVVAALNDGRILTFRGDGRGAMVRDADVPAAAWRAACPASAVRIADLDGDRRAEIIAAFAGESGDCPSGGGIGVWSTASAQRIRRRTVGH